MVETGPGERGGFLPGNGQPFKPGLYICYYIVFGLGVPSNDRVRGEGGRHREKWYLCPELQNPALNQPLELTRCHALRRGLSDTMTSDPDSSLLGTGVGERRDQ